MTYRDHADPEIFKECVSAVTLKGRPQGLLEEWLVEAEVIITIAPGQRRGSQKVRPWLAVDELDELPWASKVREAVIESDHLETSAMLLNLSNVERLTIFVLGDSFADSDLETFQNALESLEKLTHLSIVVAPSALSYANEHFVWKRSGVTYAIATESHRRR